MNDRMSHRRLRFSLRTLLAVVFVLAIVLGWWLDHRRLGSRIDLLELQNNQLQGQIPRSATLPENPAAMVLLGRHRAVGTSRPTRRSRCSSSSCVPSLISTRLPRKWANSSTTLGTSRLSRFWSCSIVPTPRCGSAARFIGVPQTVRRPCPVDARNFGPR